MRHYIRKGQKKWFKHLIISRGGAASQDFVKVPGDPHDHQVKCVCHPKCNGGWMKDIEDTIKPILVPLIRGEKRRLSQQEQVLIATWVAVKCTVLEFDPGGDQISTWKQRRTLARRKRPSPTWKIWIGHYSGTGFKLSLSSYGLIFGPVPPNKANKLNSQSFTYVCGHLLIHLIRLPRHLKSRAWEFPLPVASKLRKIWPVRAGASGFTINWPPVALDGEEAESVSSAFYRWSRYVGAK